VARRIWEYAREFLVIGQLDVDYLSVDENWLHAEKYYVVNMISTAILRGV
jgi:hypothetical protein